MKSKSGVIAVVVSLISLALIVAVPWKQRVIDENEEMFAGIGAALAKVAKEAATKPTPSPTPPPTAPWRLPSNVPYKEELYWCHSIIEWTKELDGFGTVYQYREENILVGGGFTKQRSIGQFFDKPAPGRVMVKHYHGRSNHEWTMVRGKGYGPFVRDAGYVYLNEQPGLDKLIRMEKWDYKVWIRRQMFVANDRDLKKRLSEGYKIVRVEGWIKPPTELRPILKWGHIFVGRVMIQYRIGYERVKKFGYLGKVCYLYNELGSGLVPLKEYRTTDFHFDYRYFARYKGTHRYGQYLGVAGYCHGRWQQGLMGLMRVRRQKDVWQDEYVVKPYQQVSALLRNPKLNYNDPLISAVLLCWVKPIQA